MNVPVDGILDAHYYTLQHRRGKEWEYSNFDSLTVAKSAPTDACRTRFGAPGWLSIEEAKRALKHVSRYGFGDIAGKSTRDQPDEWRIVMVTGRIAVKPVIWIAPNIRGAARPKHVTISNAAPTTRRARR